MSGKDSWPQHFPWLDKLLPVSQFSSVQSLSCVRLFATPWTAAFQASLSIPNSWSLLKLMSISQSCHPNISSSVVPLSSCLQSFSASESFPMSQFFTSGGPSIGVASASVLPMNFQNWFHLGLTGLTSLQSKGLSRVFSNTTVQKHQIFILSFLYSPTLTSIHDYWKNHSFDEMEKDISGKWKQDGYSRTHIRKHIC